MNCLSKLSSVFQYWTKLKVPMEGDISEKELNVWQLTQNSVDPTEKDCTDESPADVILKSGEGDNSLAEPKQEDTEENQNDAFIWGYQEGGCSKDRSDDEGRMDDESMRSLSLDSSTKVVKTGLLVNKFQEVLEDLSLPILEISLEEVTELSYHASLKRLEKKIEMIRARNVHKTIKQVLENAKDIAVEKINKFYTKVVDKLCHQKPNTKSIKGTLKQYKYLFPFLVKYDKTTANRITYEYILSMNYLYFKYFKRLNYDYKEKWTKSDLIGTDKEINRFELNNRHEIFYTSPEDSDFDYIEQTFKTIHELYIGVCCHEHEFIRDIFMLEDEEASSLFDEMMGRSHSLINETIRNLIDECNDPIGLMLSYQLLLRFKGTCEHVPMLDVYCCNLLTTLLCRYKFLLQLNISSVRNLDRSELGTNVGLHFVTKRFTQYAYSMVHIIGKSCAIINDLHVELHQVMQQFFDRVQMSFEAHNMENQKVTFNIINCQHILDKLGRGFFGFELYSKRYIFNVRTYQRLILREYFNDLVEYVDEAEVLLKNSSIGKVMELQKCSPNVLYKLSCTWRASLQKLHLEILALPKPGCYKLLERTLDLFIQYYSRFYRLLPPDIQSRALKLGLIIAEVKQYCLLTTCD